MPMRPLVLLTVLTACDASVMGPRLKEITLRAEGVPAMPDGWLDTELDEPCFVAPATDGVRRCLPARTAEFSGAYADEACTRELYFGAELDCDRADPRFAHGVSRSLALATTVEIVELERVDPALPRAYAAQFTAEGRFTCIPSVEPVVANVRERLAGRSLWRRKQVVPPERFVRVVGEERSAGVPTRVFDVMEDGARIPRERLDATGAPCSLAAYEEGGFCLPYTAHSGGEFADEACQSKAYRVGEPSPPPPILIADASATCADALARVRIYDSEARVGPLYVVGPNGCTRSRESASYVVRGGERDLNTLTRVTLRREGEGRLEALTYLDDRGERVGVAQLWDRELAMTCTPALASDGSYRCLPSAFGGEHFADDACSERRLAVACAQASEGLLVRDFGGSCRTSRVRRLGAFLGDGPRFGVAGDACQPISFWAGPRAPNVPTYAVGEELPPERFARFERSEP